VSSKEDAGGQKSEVRRPYILIAICAKNRARIPEIILASDCLLSRGCPFSRGGLLSLDFFKAGFHQVVVAGLQGAYVVAVSFEDVAAGQGAATGLAVGVDDLVFG